MWQDLLAAVALVLVIEGMLPFVSPQRYRQTLEAVTKLEDRNLRTIGFVSMMAGVILLYLVR
ncbi:MAG: DUF2065 domain-containing protein [Gammaproteobacteria bacterium]|nr:DUF2065 domain-containing protein [Gammaproteobacteria bacterium]MBI5615982.1 DUF2065 domain-containing protein [Gammaproteobacteria bacterium]